eukprot:Pgem_evm1s6724
MDWYPTKQAKDYFRSILNKRETIESQWGVLAGFYELYPAIMPENFIKRPDQITLVLQIHHTKKLWTAAKGTMIANGINFEDKRNGQIYLIAGSYGNLTATIEHEIIHTFAEHDDKGASIMNDEGGSRITKSTARNLD